MPSTSHPPLDAATVRELAVRASVCPYTIRQALAGRPIRGLAGHRARRLLAEVGLLPPETLAGPRQPSAGEDNGAVGSKSDSQGEAA